MPPTPRSNPFCAGPPSEWFIDTHLPPRWAVFLSQHSQATPRGLPPPRIPLVVLSDIWGPLLLPFVEMPTFQLLLPQEGASTPI